MNSYQQAAAALGSKDRKKIAHNTYLVRRGAGGIGVVFHDTLIVEYCAAGVAVIRNGGYFTATTKDRLNRFSPVRVHQRKGEWFVNGAGLDKDVPFTNGMVVKA